MFEDRWYQSEAEYSIFDYFDRGNQGNPVVAMPTGTGKSVVIGRFTRRVLQTWPNQRLMMLTHVKELIEQNARKLQQIWPTAPLGIYSAGLGRKDTIMPITFGGVASVVKNIDAFGHRDLLLIDEAHLLSPKEDTMYQKVIDGLKAINPWLKVIGFTATPYRLKQGMITEDGIFTDVCYDLCNIESFNRLIAEGYLAPLIPRPTTAQIDTSNLGIVGGDYNEAQAEAEVEKVLYAALKETCEFAYDRRSWMVFTAGVKSAEHAAEILRGFGVAAAAVHSKKPGKENDRIIEDFKAGQLRCIVNANKLTTGFDHEPLDLIAMLRPTASPGLWVQMLGRGTRPFQGSSVFPGAKSNCLVLDFAGNTPRLGPINDPVKPRKPGQRGGGDAPVRICESCGVYNHASARNCVNCGAEFSFETKIFGTSGTGELIRSDLPIVEYFPVSHVIYQRHEKDGSPPMVKVTYFCGFHAFTEYVMPESTVSIARKRARDWWRMRHPGEPPESTHEILYRTSELRTPSKLRIWVNKKYPEILSHEF